MTTQPTLEGTTGDTVDGQPVEKPTEPSPGVLPSVVDQQIAHQPPGGIVDRDYVGRSTSPVYVYAGATMAGESLFDCDQCRSLVKESGQSQHSVFHGILNGVANRIGMQTG